MKKLFYSIIIIFVALIALAGIWCPELFSKVFQWIDWAKNWLLTLLVIVVAVLFLLCACCPFQSSRGKQECVSNEEEPETEKPASPYPDNCDWKCISGFSYDSDLILMRRKDGLKHIDREAQYIVAKDYRISFDLDGKRHSITVPKGMLTDLASVPRMFRFIAGRVGPHLEACVVHDYLYLAWQREYNSQEGITPTEDMRRFADQLMLVAMYTAGMGCKARLIYWAVRCFGCCIFYSKKPEPLILCKKHFPECCSSK